MVDPEPPVALGFAAIGKVTEALSIGGRVQSACTAALWGIDAVMSEHQARAREDNAPENLALLRRLALNIIKRNQD